MCKVHRKVLYFFVVLVLPVIVNAKESPVHEYKLDNGLKLLVKEDHRAPIVVSQVWYKVGSSYEYDGITGISHVLEHMMFKGTDNHPPGEFSRIIAANGGRENAFTGRDYTAYFQRLENSRLPVSFKLEADRMRHLRLLPNEVAKELQVVMEERRMRTDDKPRSKAYEHFLAMAYSNSPYKNPVIGWPADIENLKLTDLEAWYKQWYAPNNATVVVVGDVVPGRVHALAKKYFGPLKPSQIELPKPRPEVAQLGERRMVIKVPAKTPYLIMGYKVPVLSGAKREWEAYALEVLAGILDAGKSARLSERLIRGSQVAVSANAGYDLYARLPALFILVGTPVQGKTTGQLEQSLKAEIRQLKQQPVDVEELERVKAQVMASAVYERDSGFYQAMQLGILETVKLGWQKMDEYVERVNSVTPTQIQFVAKKYLIDDHLSVASLQPLTLENKQPFTPRYGGRHGQ